jgi:hypothetical protein
MLIQVQKTQSRDRRVADVPETELETRPERNEKLADSLDDVIDEIDALLAENQEVLENFTQVSGE